MMRRRRHGRPKRRRRRPVRNNVPHVTIRGLSKRFGATVIYENFDLDILRGALVSVFGPNGCGKSTLINTIAGLIRLTPGISFSTDGGSPM